MIHLIITHHNKFLSNKQMMEGVFSNVIRIVNDESMEYIHKEFNFKKYLYKNGITWSVYY